VAHRHCDPRGIPPGFGLELAGQFVKDRHGREGLDIAVNGFPVGGLAPASGGDEGRDVDVGIEDNPAQYRSPKTSRSMSSSVMPVSRALAAPYC
jgi:hypothetical protein